MAAWLDICRFNPTTGGTTDWTFSAAVTGYQSPALAGVTNAQVYKYRAESADLTQWELGEGAYNTGTGVLARTTVLYNSSGTGTAAGQSGAGTKINFTLTPQVAIVALKEDMISISEANTFTTTQVSQALANLGNAALASSKPVIAMGAAARLNSSENINNVVTDGFYFAEAACTNQPVASTQYYLLVQKYPAGTGFVQQTAWDVTASGGVWTRNISSGTPTTWVPLLNAGAQTLTTAQKAQVQANIKVSGPTLQTFLTGTAATYTTPANCTWIRIRLVGGGAGGGGGGTGAPGDGGSGTASTWSGGTLSAGGGAAVNTKATVQIPGLGGTSSGGNVANVPGGDGAPGSAAATGGGQGGGSWFAGGGSGARSANAAGVAGRANTGAGGGGGTGAAPNAAGGGGAGGYVEHIILAPAANYTYTVGASGTAGAAGTTGGAGGAGAVGQIIVEEYYD